MNETIQILSKIIADNNEQIISLNRAYLQALDTIIDLKKEIAELEITLKFLK